jgi:nucleoside phosphorylase
MDRHVALVVALSQERRALQRLVTSVRPERVGEFRLVVGARMGQGVILVQAGIGRERARRALLAASHRFLLDAAWSLGFAGGLIDAVSPGHLVCPAVVLKDDGLQGESLEAIPAQAAVSAALADAGISTHTGSLLTVDAPLRAEMVKRAAHQRTGAMAVDMEAAGVAEAARDLQLPWLAIKAVVDPVTEPLPDFLARCTTARGNLRWRGVLWSCLVGGERRRTLRRLRRAGRQASLALAKGLDVALRAWGVCCSSVNISV